MKTALTTIDNPYYSADHPESGTNPRQVTAVVNLRESSVSTLAAHGILDLAQVQAAIRFRHAWETVGGIGSSSAAFGERVDMSRRPTGIAERRLQAAADLRFCRQLLGAHGYMLVGRICGDGEHIRDICRTRRQRDTAHDMLKIHLAALAASWKH
jgi:hypothetical protein